MRQERGSSVKDVPKTKERNRQKTYHLHLFIFASCLSLWLHGTPLALLHPAFFSQAIILFFVFSIILSSIPSFLYSSSFFCFSFAAATKRIDSAATAATASTDVSQQYFILPIKINLSTLSARVMNSFLFV